MTSAHGTGAAGNEKFSRLQLAVVALCALVVVFDGYDTQAIAYVAPRIAHEWKVASASFGPIFSAGLLGLAGGNLFLGPLADRFGRKSVILAAVAVFGAFALATGFATGMTDLLLFRFMTGLGLGAALPNVIALTSEYAPAKFRATAVMIMFCGFPLGSVMGGITAGPLMEISGWRAVFMVGGIVPLLLLPLLYFLLPESVRFLATRDGNERRIGHILQQIDEQQSTESFIAGVRAEKTEKMRGPAVTRLFSGGLAVSTLLLWTAFFTNLLVMYFLVNWLPTLIQEAGLPLRVGILSVAIMNLAGVAGAIALSRLLDLWNPYWVLAINYAASAVFIAVLASGASSGYLVLAAAALAGVGVVGGQIGCNAVAAAQYPTAIRATGVGWALGVGRIGAITGPLIGGSLLGSGWTPQSIIFLASVPAAIAAIAIFRLGMVHRES